MDFDLIIIGAGPGGYETAVEAARAGLKTAIVEQKYLGGTCLNCGCIPTKCFCKNAELINELGNADNYGIVGLNYEKLDINKVVERKNSVVASLTEGIKSLLKHPNITLFYGKASFIDSNNVKITSLEDGGENIVSTKNIIIATGSKTKFLPIEGVDLPCVLTSDEMLNITEIPRRLVIVGGGVIGMEFASIFNSFGSEVTVLEYCKEILPNFEADIAKRLKSVLKSRGINIINNAEVKRISAGAQGDCSVTYLLKNETCGVDADVVLMAVGRVANTESLNLDDIAIAYSRRGIEVDNNFQTNIKGIYAIGDINGQCQLAHAATFQGKRALNAILGRNDKIRFDVMPAAVFTYPEVASVGMTSEQCKEKGVKVKSHKAFFRSNGKALSMNETEGIVKILADENDFIVGGHIMGPHASDLIQQISYCITKNMKIEEVCDMIHAHPTLSEIILSSVQS